MNAPKAPSDSFSLIRLRAIDLFNRRTSQFTNGSRQPQPCHWWVENDDLVLESNWPTSLVEIQEAARALELLLLRRLLK